MKRKIFIVAMAALALTTAGCSKEKKCRCSVLHQSRVRVITIESGECEDLRAFRYHTPLDSLKVDSLLCTDHEFEVDK